MEIFFLTVHFALTFVNFAIAARYYFAHVSKYFTAMGIIHRLLGSSVTNSTRFYVKALKMIIYQKLMKSCCVKLDDSTFLISHSVDGCYAGKKGMVKILLRRKSKSIARISSVDSPYVDLTDEYKCFYEYDVVRPHEYYDIAKRGLFITYANGETSSITTRT